MQRGLEKKLDLCSVEWEDDSTMVDAVDDLRGALSSSHRFRVGTRQSRSGETKLMRADFWGLPDFQALAKSVMEAAGGDGFSRTLLQAGLQIGHPGELVGDLRRRVFIQSFQEHQRIAQVIPRCSRLMGLQCQLLHQQSERG